ncbi:MAG: hypothetical protein ACI4X9_01445, partial [Kiritimatiellia bacterium]
LKGGSHMTVVGNAAVGEGVVVEMEGGAVSATSSVYLRQGGRWLGGTVETTGELQYGGEVAVEGTEFTCSLLACQVAGGGPLNLRSGLIQTSSSSWNGFYSNGSYVNFVPGGSGAFAFVFSGSAPDVYATYFAGSAPMMRYGGKAVSKEEFGSLFEVTADEEAGVCTVALRQVAGLAVFDESGTSLRVEGESAGRISALLSDAGSPAAELFFCYGKSDGGKDLEAWERKVSLGTAVAGETLSGAFEAEAGTAYRWALAARNDSGTVWSSASGGTFMTAAVSIEAPSELKEGSTAVVTFRRPAGSNLSELPLTINCTLSGTATGGVHYNLSPGSVLTFSAGSSEAVLTIESIPDWDSNDEPVIVLGIAPASPCLPGTPSVSIPIRNSAIPAGPTNVWIGALSADATDPANWSQQRLPDEATIVLFSPQFAKNPIEWKSAMPERIAGWLQPHPFTDNTLIATFETTPEKPLSISGDAILDYGFWTSAGPDNPPQYALNIEVGGNLRIGPDAQLSVGNDELNIPRGYARGWFEGGDGFLPGKGASYAGEGAGGNAQTYGSILDPLSHGSSGKGDSKAYAGAGTIRLIVAQDLTLNGQINAIGFGWSSLTQQGASSGGSINLTAARLLGNGTIRADGGRDFMNGSGSGGRIRIKQTEANNFDQFLGTITAKGADGGQGLEGDTPYETVGSAAGTITLQTAADTPNSARILVSNGPWRTADLDPSELPATHLPAKLNPTENLKATDWELANHARVRLTAPTVRLRTLALQSGTRILTENAILRVNSLTLDGVKQPAGTYTAESLPDYLSGPGTLLVGGSPTILMIQ